MKIPAVYELNGRRRYLLVQDGETISVGRGAACSIQVQGDVVQEVELKAQFVNGCQFVVVHPANGGVPYAQPLPWKVTLGGSELQLLLPFKSVQGEAGRELVVQGLAAGETRLVLQANQPLLLGSSQDCAVVIPDAGCPEVLLALWAAAGGRVLVQVLEDSVLVGWLGRAGETEAELELPVSLSIGGRVLLIKSGAAAEVQRPVAKPMVAAAAASLKEPAIWAKSAEAGPKIVARQVKPTDGKEEKADLPDRPVVLAPTATNRPVVLPPPAALSTSEGVPIMTLEEAMNSHPKPAGPTAFIFFSWLQVGLTYAVALLPEQGIELWAAAGGMLILTLLLGLVALLK